MGKKTINEVTSTGGIGYYKVPPNLVPRIWNTDNMVPPQYPFQII
jgi:hypothetical protein